MVDILDRITKLELEVQMRINGPRIGSFDQVRIDGVIYDVRLHPTNRPYINLEYLTLTTNYVIGNLEDTSVEGEKLVEVYRDEKDFRYFRRGHEVEIEILKFEHPDYK